MEDLLKRTWFDKTPAQTVEFFKKRPDVKVTNQSDKIEQLQKIELLNEHVQTVCQALEPWRQAKLDEQKINMEAYQAYYNTNEKNT